MQLTGATPLAQTNQVTALKEAYQLVGQMTLVKFTMLEDQNGIARYSNIAKYHLGTLLVGGGKVPGPNGTFIAGINDPADHLSSTRYSWLHITNQAKANLPIV